MPEHSSCDLFYDIGVDIILSWFAPACKTGPGARGRHSSSSRSSNLWQHLLTPNRHRIDERRTTSVPSEMILSLPTGALEAAGFS
eukprot:805229-Amphidinium_carterae.1